MLFLFNIFGYYIPFLLKRSEIKTEMREKINEIRFKDNVVKLTFPLHEKHTKIEWKEEGKEFRYKDEMYDIVKIEYDKDSISYFCLQDKDENILISKFDQLVKNNFENNGKNKNNPLKELSKYNLNDITEFYPVINKVLSNAFNPVFYKSLSLETQFPPPKKI